MLPRKSKKEAKKKPIKKVPLGIGLVFILIGAICLVYVFISPEAVQMTYVTMSIAFFGFGITSLDKSGILER